MPLAYGGSSKWFSTRFSATVNEPTNPSCLRSSGTKPRPASMISFGLRPVIGFPSSSTRPRTVGVTPEQGLGQLGLPVALDPGDADDLPAGHLEVQVVDHQRAVGRGHRHTLHWSAADRGVRRGRLLATSSSTARPTISSASWASESVGLAWPTTLPRRITVIVSAMARTSRSLWVMKTIALPSSRSDRTTAISSSISCGVSTAVGSSKIRYFASLASAFRISTRCWTPTGRSSTSASGSTSRWYRSRQLPHRTPGLVHAEPAGRPLLPAEHQVLGHGEHLDQHEVLVHHADPGGDRLAWGCG